MWAMEKRPRGTCGYARGAGVARHLSCARWAGGDNPASAYIRVALVDEQETMTAALKRLKEGLESFNPVTKGAT